MHELSITQSLVDLALEKAHKAGARQVSRIDVSLGELSGVVGDCMRLYFDALTRDTIAAGATLEIERVPVAVKCRDCGHNYPPGPGAWRCPECGSAGAEIVSGRECYLTSIEVT